MSRNYPSYIPGCIIRQKNLCNKRLNPLLAMPPSSVILHTDESGNFPESRKNPASLSSSGGSLLTAPNTVGIIGGLSADSTLSFLRKIVHFSKENEEKCMPFVVCSDPALNRELSLLEESYSSFAVEMIFRNSIIPGLLTVYRVKGISSRNRELTALELKEAKLKPLEAGSPLRIGVLGTDATLKAGFYQEKLQEEGFEVVLPDKATMEHTVIPAMDALNRNDMEGARNLLRIALQVLLVRAVNTVILASDDMRNLFPQNDPLLQKCTDPMDALARSTIKWAQQAVQEGT
ncbi:putative Cc-nbs-lrr resistance protein [Hibiscus syriacus]|uniref:Cc-nbs-lrr resistance protein n=1 Tax=Hibiscus syriacus TaxID=106335 RepID=A0A6A3A8A3_HIBSY|nr:putative Cc-nbs-lrr resistance protein [Hibiscus syriacus]